MSSNRRLLAVILLALGLAAPARATQPISAQQQEAVAKNAALVQQMLGERAGIAFDFGPASVEWMDGYISRIRGTTKEPGRLSQVLGSYLGEAIRRRDGGRWVRERDGEVGLELARGFVVYPFAKVEKHFANGEGDSVLALYRSIPPLHAAHRGGGLRAPGGR